MVFLLLAAACGTPRTVPRSQATTGAQATAEQGGEASGIEPESQPPAISAAVPPIGGKITSVRVVAGETVVTIDKGSGDGVGKGWTGYVVDSVTGGKLAGSDFKLIRVDDRTSSGKLPFTAEEATSNPDVVLVPPPPGP